MNYNLNKNKDKTEKTNITTAIRRLWPLMVDEKINLAISLSAIVITSLATLTAPRIIGHIIDSDIRLGNYHGLVMRSLVLILVYIVWTYSSYIQTKTMGGVGRRVLFNLRNVLFKKIQSLPLAFFNQNKAGDLISRINNDTDQLNQFFSQALIQLLGNFFLIAGAGIFILVLNFRLGLAALLPAIIVFIITRVLSGWVKNRNMQNLQAVGKMSAEIQESINNFKVIAAFNRLDYFRNKFAEVNQNNFQAAVSAGIANNIFTPIYGLAANFGQLIVLCYGIHLILIGQFTIGLLISFLLYVNSFYTPLRHLATFWSSLQQALAGLDRIHEVLSLESDMPIMPEEKIVSTNSFVMEFDQVNFKYDGGKEVLKNVSFALEHGKTYALVGPTGGGKTTTASLMARLYDPSTGMIFLNGHDIRSFSPEERAQKIGFILQEPFLFTGTVRDNIIYSNDRYLGCSDEELKKVIEETGLSGLLDRFEHGLETKIATSGDAISLGQKQLIAFMRAVLRSPDILILDEATANIDTVTEQQLEEILAKLPAATTKVIIAHRLNTIKNADAIFFVNGGEVKLAGSMEHTLELLLHGQRQN